MRLFLLPISTRRALIYCKRINKQLNVETGYLNRAQNKAADTWAKWESAEKGWQKKITQYGNQAFKRIPYEEWGLKSIPPLSARKDKSELAGDEKITIHYPENVVRKENISEILRRLATERQGLHETKLRWSLIGLPFMIPFALIPVIPNIPFFYMAFRAWSHWRALKGSQHLEYLVKNNLITPTSTPELSKIYAKSKEQAKYVVVPQTQAEKETLTHPEERMLLDHSSSQVVARSLMVPGLAAEVERAVTQVQNAMSAEEELADEKRKLDEAHKPKT